MDRGIRLLLFGLQITLIGLFVMHFGLVLLSDQALPAFQGAGSTNFVAGGVLVLIGLACGIVGLVRPG